MRKNRLLRAEKKHLKTTQEITLNRMLDGNFRFRDQLYKQVAKLERKFPELVEARS